MFLKSAENGAAQSGEQQRRKRAMSAGHRLFLRCGVFHVQTPKGTENHDLRDKSLFLKAKGLRLTPSGGLSVPLRQLKAGRCRTRCHKAFMPHVPGAGKKAHFLLDRLRFPP
ncbi:MAG: hypothetical protein HFF17_01690 [Oscillospiraceae bacterium]|nr:hypothetical protein [Oscillospiraceae bacterium]